MIGYDLFGLDKDYTNRMPLEMNGLGAGIPKTGLTPMPAGTPGSMASAPQRRSVWSRAKDMLGDGWSDDPVAEGQRTAAMSTGSQALAGIFQQGEDEKATQRGYAMDEIALADQMHRDRSQRAQRTRGYSALASL